VIDNEVIKKLNDLHLESKRNEDVIIEALNLISDTLSAEKEIISLAISNCSDNDFDYVDIFHETKRILNKRSFSDEYIKKLILSIDSYLFNVMNYYSKIKDDYKDEKSLLMFKNNLYLLENHLRALRDYL